MSIEFELDLKRPDYFRCVSTASFPGSTPSRPSDLVQGGEGRYFARRGFAQAATNEYGSLGAAIESTAGGSQGASYFVPDLFFHPVSGYPLQFPGFSLHRLRELKVERNELFDNGQCVVISGTPYEGARYFIWVNLRDGLLRKLRLERENGFVEEVHRSIEINPAIPKSRFVRKP